jgi:hypothetical protein
MDNIAILPIRATSKNRAFVPFFNEGICVKTIKFLPRSAVTVGRLKSSKTHTQY